MSIRYQINLRILLIALLILILASYVTIHQARHAVTKEVDASVQLALQMIKIGLGNSQPYTLKHLKDLSNLTPMRHLKIQLQQSSGKIIDLAHPKSHPPLLNHTPKWFSNLVISQYPKAHYQIHSTKHQAISLIIQANPMDEITEVWHESVFFLCSILVLTLSMFISIQLVFNNALSGIKRIIKQLQTIQLGEYPQALPNFKHLEYQQIAEAINHMSYELHHSQEQNRALTQHSLDIQEEERQRLSQELHDEFGQSLTAIKVMATTASLDKTDSQKMIHAIIPICDHLMDIVRSMIKQLHPLILEELGLKATLEDLQHHWQSLRPTIQFNLNVDNDVNQLDPKIIIQVFRIIQESLTNIIRHANATQIDIKLKISQQQLNINITDNGQGCNLTKLTVGFGLQGIKERVKLLKGSIQLHSQPQQGMNIKLTVPIKLA